MGRNKNETTRENLINAGLRAFLQRGFGGTGIKEIVEDAAVPKGSFYAYFPSKEDFAVAVIEHYAACFVREMDEAFHGHSSPRGALLAFLRQLGQDFESDAFRGGCLIANLAGELEYSEKCVAALRQGYAAWQDRLASLIQQGQTAGEFRSDIPPSEMAALLVDSWEGAVLRMKVTDSQEPLHRCIRHIVEELFSR